MPTTAETRNLDTTPRKRAPNVILLTVLDCGTLADTLATMTVECLRATLDVLPLGTRMALATCYASRAAAGCGTSARCMLAVWGTV